MAESMSCVVLLVDDQAMVGEALRRMLSHEADITLHFCPDARRALEAARYLKPTVILQDLVMPGVNGLSLLTQYREDPIVGQVPVIVLSSTEDPVVKSDAFSAGASDYLVKLPDRIELAARIRLHSRARLNQLQRDQAHEALRTSEERLIAKNAELLVANQRLQDMTERLRVEATRDALSGLLNRRAFFDALQRELARSQRTAEPIALLIGDIDHFKTVNDSRGHVAGDAVIQDVARRLQEMVRAADLVGRYGGEEFVILAGDCAPEAAVELAERMRRAVADSPIRLVDGNLAITMSVGVAVSTGHTGAEELLAAADAALYRAKRAGRNLVEMACA
jgi:two-component system chemotaxis family response regulator WspR